MEVEARLLMILSDLFLSMYVEILVADVLVGDNRRGSMSHRGLRILDVLY